MKQSHHPTAMSLKHFQLNKLPSQTNQHVSQHCNEKKNININIILKIAPAPATTIIVQQMHTPCFGPKSQNVTCPSCKSQITTKVKDRVSFRTHAAAYLLCLIGCLPCCLFPYCVSSCQNQMQ